MAFMCVLDRHHTATHSAHWSATSIRSPARARRTPGAEAGASTAAWPCACRPLPGPSSVRAWSCSWGDRAPIGSRGLRRPRVPCAHGPRATSPQRLHRPAPPRDPCQRMRRLREVRPGAARGRHRDDAGRRVRVRRPPAAPCAVAIQLVPGVRRQRCAVRGVQVEGGCGDAQRRRRPAVSEPRVRHSRYR